MTLYNLYLQDMNEVANFKQGSNKGLRTEQPQLPPLHTEYASADNTHMFPLVLKLLIVCPLSTKWVTSPSILSRPNLANTIQSKLYHRKMVFNAIWCML